MPSPLSSSPYNSRNLEYPKYSFVAFKPGTPLQASELNELQENINYQNSETMKFLYDIASGDNYIPLQQTSGLTSLPVPTSLNFATVVDNYSDFSVAVPSRICITLNSHYKIWNKFNILPNTGGLIKPDPFGGPSPYIQTNVQEAVLLTNRNNQVSLGVGDHFIAVKVNYEWRIMGAGGGGGAIVGKFKKINCSSPNITKTTVPPFELQSFDYGNVGEVEKHFQIKFFDVGSKKVYYFQSDQELLSDLIPSEAAGGKIVQSDGILDITNYEVTNITNPDGSVTASEITLPYSGYFYVVAFNNCEMSSNVYTYKLAAPDQYVAGLAPVVAINNKPLSKLFDCPNSSDNFGVVTDDQSGAEFYAMHPFKYIKHDVRVMAMKSNMTVVCNGEMQSAYAIVEVDECANAGTGLARE